MEILGEAFTGAGTVTTHTCPLCGGGLQEVVGDARDHWLCVCCGRCWRPVHERLRAVDPIRCPGCETGSQESCLARFGKNFPQFCLALDA
ncbi:MAG TPA: hypothetical protein VFZ83_08885 [Acidimicrobiia bacterium]|nr:hypothetical protein [Acidimicrobiia bacterium]